MTSPGTRPVGSWFGVHPSGAGAVEVIPASQFGADGDGVTDMWSRLQEWAESAIDNPREGVRTLYLNNSRAAGSGTSLGNLGQGAGFVHSKPIVVPMRGGIRMLGSRQNRRENYAPGSRLWPSFAYGWPLVFEDGQREPDLVPSILGVSGKKALRRKNTYSNELLQYLRLRDAATLELHGLTALTVEFFYQHNGADDGWVVSSYGRRFVHELANDTTNGAFIVSTTSGRPQFDIQTSAGHLALRTNLGQTQDGLVHHVVCQWRDGHASIRVDGIVTAEQDHGGTLVQDPGEEVNFGTQHSLQPAVFVLANAPEGVWESLRISDVGRYPASGNITPPSARFVNDSHTLALLNFDDNVHCSLKVNTRDGDFWAYLQGLGDPNGTGDESAYLFSPHALEVDGISIDGDINVGGSARQLSTCGLLISAPSMYGVDISHVSIARTRCGIRLGGLGNAYDMMVRRLHVDCGWGEQGRYGAEAPNLTGLTNWDQCWMQGGQVALYSGAGSTKISGMHFEADARSIYSLILRSEDASSGPHELSRVTFSTEGGVGPLYRNNMAVASIASGARVIGSGIAFQSNNSDAWAATHKPILVSGTVQVTLETPAFGEFPGAGSARMDELVTAASDFTGRVVIRNPKFGLAAPHPPYSLTRGAVAVVVEGVAIVAYSATPVFDAAVASTFEITLTGNVTSSTFVRAGEGQRILFRVIQDGTGSRTFAWPANVLGAEAISAAIAAVTQQEFEYDGTYLRAVAAKKVT